MYTRCTTHSLSVVLLPQRPSARSAHEPCITPVITDSNHISILSMQQVTERFSWQICHNDLPNFFCSGSGLGGRGFQLAQIRKAHEQLQEKSALKQSEKDVMNYIIYNLYTWFVGLQPLEPSVHWILMRNGFSPPFWSFLSLKLWGLSWLVQFRWWQMWWQHPQDIWTYLPDPSQRLEMLVRCKKRLLQRLSKRWDRRTCRENINPVVGAWKSSFYIFLISSSSSSPVWA